MMLPLRATGQSLTLRYPEPADAPALYELGRDPQTTRFLSWGPYGSIEEARAWLASRPADREAGTELTFVVEHRVHGPIGATALTEHSARDRRAVVGSWLGRSFWGTGANTEAKALLARIAFEHLALERLGAYASPRNARSVAALTKLGWQVEGTLRGFHRHGDEVHDVHVLSLLRAEWERSPLHAIQARAEGEPPAAFAR